MNYYSYLYGEKVAEDKKSEYNSKKYYLIECKDGEHQLRDLINYIGKNGNGGHSFDIVVDPNDKQNEKHFFWDGDGPDRIHAVVESKSGDDKELVGILLAALQRVQSISWVAKYDDNPEVGKYQSALQSINDIVTPLPECAGLDDYMKDALREIKFICNNDDSAEQKIKDIKYQAEEALK